MTEKPRVNRTKKAYLSVFMAPNGEMPDAQRAVLADLVKFCAGGRTPRCQKSDGGVDTNATMIAIGRQEVWHHVNQMLGIPELDVVRMAIPQDQ